MILLPGAPSRSFVNLKFSLFFKENDVIMCFACDFAVAQLRGILHPGFVIGEARETINIQMEEKSNDQ